MRWWAVAMIGVAIGCSRDSAEHPRIDDAPAAAPAQERPPAAPEPAPEQQRAIAASELLDTVEQLALLHTRHAADCSALAEAIVIFHGEHMPALAETPAEILAFVDADERLRTRMRTAMESIMSASMGCRDNPAFAAAQQQLFGE